MQLALAAAVTLVWLPLSVPAGPAVAQEAQSSPGGPATVSPTGTQRTLRVAFPRDDGSLSPYTFEVGYQLVTLVYDTLLLRDTDGVPRPWLAAGVDTSPDGRQITVRLREDAAWHDGTPLTATDVAFTLSHVQRRFHPRFTPQLHAVHDVTVRDDHTVVIELSRPSPGFADQPLADLPILPAHLWHDLPEHRLAPAGLPVGSGPYRLSAHDEDDGYRFEAVADHFAGPPALEIIEVVIIRTAGRTLSALEDRRVDLVPVALPTSAQQRVRRLGIRVVDGPGYLGTVLAFNLRQPPFDDPATRTAVARALDLQQITRAVGHAVPADRGVLHPTSPWAHDQPLHDHDPQAAADTLSQLALPALDVLAPNNDPVKTEAARQVAQALRQAGADAQAVQVSSDELDQRLGAQGHEPQFQLAITATPPLSSYDPDFLRVVFGSDRQQAALNHTGYASDRFDQLAEQVATTIDADARQQAVNAQLELLADDLPVVPLFFADGVFAYRPAAYDRFTYITGRGILDKRSFLAGNDPLTASTPPSPVPTEVAATDPPPGGSSGLASDVVDQVGPLGLAAAGLLLVALILVGIALAGRRN